MRAGLDHIVYACSDLTQACVEFERRSGIRPVYGGLHSGGATHNAIVPLRDDCYLEILAPVNGQAAELDGWARLAAEAAPPRVLTYCLRTALPLEQVAVRLPREGWLDTHVRQNGRVRPDGVALNWSWLNPGHPSFGLAFPFFIDWHGSPHPSAIAGPAPACQLKRFEVRHPAAASLTRVLRALDAEVAVEGGEPGFTLSMETPRGEVVL
jgi:hypothetical protein